MIEGDRKRRYKQDDTPDLVYSRSAPISHLGLGWSSSIYLHQTQHEGIKPP
jgi:hypothetical protein